MLIFVYRNGIRDKYIVYRKGDKNMKIKKITNAISKIVTLATAAVILVAGCVVLPGLAGIKPFIVLSGSMEPAVHTGAVAYVNTRATVYEPEDIVMFRMGDNMVTHRIVRIEDSQYITKGDANETEDMVPVSADQMVGTYMFQIPFLGFLAAKLSPGLLAVIAVWILFLNGMSMLLTWAVDRTE